MAKGLFSAGHWADRFINSLAAPEEPKSWIEHVSKEHHGYTRHEIWILSSQDLQTVMRFDDYVDAVAEAFRMLAEGRCESPVPLQVSVTDGTFHAKAELARGVRLCCRESERQFPDNRSRHGLPTIQGAVFLADANNGRPLALLDSIEITVSGPRPPQRLPLSIWPDRILVPPRSADVATKAAFNYRHCGTSSTSRRFLLGTSTPKPHAAFQPRWRWKSGSTLRPLMICVKEHWSVMQL